MFVLKYLNETILKKLLVRSYVTDSFKQKNSPNNFLVILTIFFSITSI